GGGACDGFATQMPFLNSCQGKHWLGSDCAIAGNELKNARQLKMTAAAEKRVMLKPRCLSKQAENNSNEIPFAIPPMPALLCDLANITGLFGLSWLVCLGCPQRIKTARETGFDRKEYSPQCEFSAPMTTASMPPVSRWWKRSPGLCPTTSGS